MATAIKRKARRDRPASKLPNKLHANYEIRWKNYRSFDDTGWIQLRPLTILIGANNSGKSSVLSPLLLLSQTLASNDSKTPLITRGPLVDLGNYKDFVHLHDITKEVYFGLRLHTHEATKGTGSVGGYPPGAIELTFGACDEPRRIALKRYDVFDVYKRLYASSIAIDEKTFSIGNPDVWTGLSTDEKDAIQSARPTNFLFSPTSIISALERDRDADRARAAKNWSKTFEHYLSVVSYAYSMLRSTFSDLSYIGPLRQKPLRFYSANGESATTVGAQGENAPTILLNDIDTFRDQLNAWVRRFEFGDSVECPMINNDLFELKFVSGSEMINIADVGFGASQVLPLIVQGLAAPEDSLTLAEQPEIHLNPRLQRVLADLFAQMANAGHRVVVETHSEHLILRLRSLIALGEIPSSSVALYFVERQGTRSVIREVKIEESGNIATDSWPKGFFDDALREALTLTSAQAKAKARRGR